MLAGNPLLALAGQPAASQDKLSKQMCMASSVRLPEITAADYWAAR